MNIVGTPDQVGEESGQEISESQRKEVRESVRDVIGEVFKGFEDGVAGIEVETPSDHSGKRVTWGKPLESVQKEAYDRGKREAAEEAARLLASESAERERLESEERARMPEPGSLPWGQLQEEIIQALIQDDDQFGGMAMSELAIRLRSSIEEFTYIKHASDPDIWQANRMEALLQRERLLRRGLNWDRLEDAALSKMLTMFQRGQIKSVSEVLAVARVANVATRRGQGPGGEDMSTNPNAPYVQVNIQQGGAEGGGLPGPGSIGTIKLNLSQRTVQQLSHSKVIDGDVVRLTESAEMLGGKDIPELQRLVDEDE